MILKNDKKNSLNIERLLQTWHLIQSKIFKYFIVDFRVLDNDNKIMNRQEKGKKN